MSVFTIDGEDWRAGMKAISRYEKSSRKAIHLRRAIHILGETGAKCGVDRWTMEQTMERCFKAEDFEKARMMWNAGCKVGYCRGWGFLKMLIKKS